MAINGIVIRVFHRHKNYAYLLSDQYFEITKATLNIVSKVCILCDDESVPNKCNQGIVFTSGIVYLVVDVYMLYDLYTHSGVFSAIVNYILLYCSESGNEKQEEILRRATYTLIRIVHRNEMVYNTHTIYNT